VRLWFGVDKRAARCVRWSLETTTDQPCKRRTTSQHRYPVKAGDAVWAAPYVPQWFAALGSQPARLVIYRDRNVDPMFSV